MNIEFITKDDLEVFRQHLLNDIKALLLAPAAEKKEWLRCAEVRQLLNISTGTLQNLRISGKLKSQKVGSMHYYRRSDVDNLLNGGPK